MTLPYIGEKTVNMLGTQTECSDLFFFLDRKLVLIWVVFCFFVCFVAVIFSVLGVGLGF